MSLDAKDISIGNYLTINDNIYHKQIKGNVLEVIKVDATREDIIINLVSVVEDETLYSQLIESIEPIKMNTEWLYRFGFKLVSKDKEQGSQLFEKDYVRVNVSKTGFYAVLEKNSPVFFKDYVHELQNIFNLLGKPLELFNVEGLR